MVVSRRASLCFAPIYYTIDYPLDLDYILRDWISVKKMGRENKFPIFIYQRIYSSTLVVCQKDLSFISTACFLIKNISLRTYVELPTNKFI